MKKGLAKSIRKHVKIRIKKKDLSASGRKSKLSKARKHFRVSEHVVFKASKFSIAKYVRGAFTGDWEHSHYERRVFGKTMRISKAVMDTRTLAAGGVLVPPEYAADIQMNLRAEAVIRSKLNPAVYNMKGDTLVLGKKTASTSIFWVAEGVNIDTSTYQSEPTLGRNTLVLKEAVAISKISNNLIEDGSPAADDMVRMDLVETAALEEDRVMILGIGGAEPLGIYYDAAVGGTTLDTNGDYIDYDNLMDAEYAIEAANGKYTGWLFNPRVKNDLRQLKDGSGRYIYEMGDVKKGTADTLLGLPVGWTTQVPINLTTGSATTTTFGVLANWRKVCIGQKAGGVKIEATQVGGGAWNYNQTHFRLVLRMDTLVREPVEVRLIKGIL